MLSNESFDVSDACVEVINFILGSKVQKSLHEDFITSYPQIDRHRFRGIDK